MIQKRKMKTLAEKVSCLKTVRMTKGGEYSLVPATVVPYSFSYV